MLYMLNVWSIFQIVELVSLMTSMHFYSAMLINEKIDLEIANERFVVRLGNNLENLTELKRMIKLLNDYYYQFIRDKK